MSETSLQVLKGEFRARVRHVLRSMTSEERAKQSIAVCEEVVKSEAFITSQTIGLYSPIREREVDCQPIREECWRRGKRLFLPKYHVTGRRMRFLEVRSEEDFRSLPETKWRIKQVEDWDEENRFDANTVGLDLLIVPGVAFSPQGHRLGNGFGFYDRFLSHSTALHSNSLLIGLAFREQMFDWIPSGERDFKLNSIVVSKQ